MTSSCIKQYCGSTSVSKKICISNNNKQIKEKRKFKEPASGGSCYNLRKIKMRSAQSLSHDVQLGMSWSLIKQIQLTCYTCGHPFVGLVVAAQLEVCGILLHVEQRTITFIAELWSLLGEFLISC